MGDRAHEAAERLWACAFEDATAWRGPRCFAPAGEPDRVWLEGWKSRHAGAAGIDSFVLVQCEGNLGARINYIDRELRSRGLERQIFIGTDCPELGHVYLAEAARLLEDHDAVLGPAGDGGVVLMAARRPWPPLDELPWSDASLGLALATLLGDAKWTVARLETLADVDTPEDLAATARRLHGDPRGERQALLEWIEQRGLIRTGEPCVGTNRDSDPDGARNPNGRHARDSDAAVDRGVALIVPVLGDTALLRELLARVDAWASRPAEIIVVSGGRADAELERVCLRSGARLVVAARNRGAQMDAGARAASAPVLWFVHADACLPPDGLHAIAGALGAGLNAGCFRFTFQGQPTWYKALLARLVGLRIRLGGIPYGDQGLFVRRDVYLECGGFAHSPLFEEVRLVKQLRRRGSFRVLPVPIGVSPRRWERDGWWRRSLRNRWLALRHMLGASPERLSQAYHGTFDATLGQEE
ncbi:MAG TPA: TIGR04283 family arsenosugar biosynthesis glycosyltransferase [Gammaproteobacteria bacterium]|nr:TIGR04283 family arsenosugar biosynthesis glycosyltransferase [Gammaproteobacteria bacterium]